MPSRVLALGRGTTGTALFAKLGLDERPPVPGTFNPLATAIARIPGAPPLELVAVHPDAPHDGASAGRWERDLKALPHAGGSLRILVGDFNATLDHGRLRDLIGTGYDDAADQVGAGLKATWPVGRRFPPVTIDHLLADKRIGIRSYASYEIPRSDHRAILVEVVLPLA